MGNKVALHNLGCKVNAYEIEAMQQLLEEAGYEIVPFEPGADIYVINTCTVTNIADRKSRQMLHKAKKMNPEAIVVATGCYVQTGGEKLEKDEAIDLVLGNNQKINIVEALAEYAENKPGHGSHVIKINQTKEYEELSIDHTAEHVRAYIKVQDGCNQFCTYCIIPYARGRVRSRNIESVLKEVRALAEKGYKEVVLTGIHLSSYGVDFPEEKKETLLSLIRAVHEIEGIQRIRLGSLEPGKQADFIAVDLRSPSMMPVYTHPMRNIVPNLVYSARGNEVVLSVVAGKVIMKDQQLLNIDVEQIKDEVEKLPEGVGKRAEKEFTEINGTNAQFMREDKL